MATLAESLPLTKQGWTYNLAFDAVQNQDLNESKQRCDSPEVYDAKWFEPSIAKEVIPYITR
jgi:hypothetical protein